MSELVQIAGLLLMHCEVLLQSHIPDLPSEPVKSIDPSVKSKYSCMNPNLLPKPIMRNDKRLGLKTQYAIAPKTSQLTSP